MRQRQFLLLRVATRCDCAYEWGMRVHYFAAKAGLTEEQVYASVRSVADAACLTSMVGLLIRPVDELHDTVTASDPR